MPSIGQQIKVGDVFILQGPTLFRSIYEVVQDFGILVHVKDLKNNNILKLSKGYLDRKQAQLTDTELAYVLYR